VNSAHDKAYQRAESKIIEDQIRNFTGDDDKHKRFQRHRTGAGKIGQIIIRWPRYQKGQHDVSIEMFAVSDLVEKPVDTFIQKQVQKTYPIALGDEEGKRRSDQDTDVPDQEPA
jgi:hypothetical protein